MSRSRPPEERPDSPRDGPAGPASGSAVRCPHCDSADVVLEAPFGGSLMSRQFYCRGCRTVFEWVKWEPGDSASWLPE